MLWIHFLSVKFLVALGIGYFFSITLSNEIRISFSKLNTISLHSGIVNLLSYLY